ncbi:DUF2975 domain-containing protein [Elizabethkingia miricola]|uniref:DUF2975 domain-containing protein n=1 Tax=Elizabethkingia miricola TaxID=172045 RepID=UPI000B357CA5|nr:DUF2975 domain-containing protein [Elizabethkingia miricola]NHQ65409.1 DUF2975 domain-containing protein [Elizabethkingia miricola]NHQ71040.1 DUF2975 domain-containing protein [Elizabethkingia miricola]NHQ78677.1 DUF2975 domain-containing protein [Elizabethkingia miricola]PSL89693.1 DUF2975 domain-containing protein [Elizabethkingia miricola]QHQ87330.1 DUF2975 domain-containing protein [Elizabethkingia miricola]
MKIIGKNSLARYINWGITFIFFLFFVHLIYFLSGYTICYYNNTSDSKLMANTFSTGIKLYTGLQENTFSIKYPFIDLNFFSGVFSSRLFFEGLIGFAGFAFYFYCLKKIFGALSSGNIFSLNLLKWTKLFLGFNIILGLIYTFFFGEVKLNEVTRIISHLIPFLFVFFITLFAYAFFKKGYDLQSENELTI